MRWTGDERRMLPRRPVTPQKKLETAERIRSSRHGHSTPDVAGQFATDVRAENLALTHFSPSLSNSGARMVSECTGHVLPS